MKNSLITLAEKTPMPDRCPDGPSVVLMQQRGYTIAATPHPIVDLLIGGTQAARMMDWMPIEDWVDDYGGFETLWFQMTDQLSLTLYYSKNETETLVEIERCGRTTWVWCHDESIARRIFWEGFSQVPTRPRPNARRSRKTSPHRSITAARDAIASIKTPPVAMSPPMAPITSGSLAGSIGFSLETIGTPCLN